MKTFPRLLLVFLTAVALLGPGLAAAQDRPWPTAAWQTATPEDQGMDSGVLARAVDFGIANQMDSLTVVRNGRIVLDATFTPFQPGLKHLMYSSTKSVIGTLVAIAVADGKIPSLDRRVVDYFPDRPIANLDDAKKAMTIRHLLDMTSGLQWDEPFDGLPASVIAMGMSPDWQQFVLDRPMAKLPGTWFTYNSGVSHLLSAILTKATGMSARDYAREKLFKPLGIEDVLWQADPQGITMGGYGLHLQPRDMAKIGYLWLRAGQWDGRQLVPIAFFDAVRKANVDMHESWSASLRYGDQFWVIPSADVFLAAGLNRQLIIVLPRRDMVIVATGGTRRDRFGTAIAPRYGFGELISAVTSAIKSENSLPPDAAAQALLTERLKAATVETPGEPGRMSETAKRIAGKTFRFPMNVYQLKSVRFDLSVTGMSFEYELTNLPGKFGGPIGFDGRFAVGGMRPWGPGAARGTWTDSNTLVFETQTLGNDDLARSAHVFGERTVDLSYEGTNSLRFTLQGRLDD